MHGHRAEGQLNLEQIAGSKKKPKHICCGENITGYLVEDSQ